VRGQPLGQGDQDGGGGGVRPLQVVDDDQQRGALSSMLKGFLQFAQQPEPLIGRLGQLADPRGIDGRVGGRDKGVQDRAEWHCPGGGIPAAAEHSDAAVRGQARGLVQQRSLARAGRPGNEHDAAAPGAERVQLPAKHIHLRLPTTQSGRHRAIVIQGQRR
jgi:hypothetical protein